MGGVERFSASLLSELTGRGATVTVCDCTLLDFREHWFDRKGLGTPRAAWMLGKAAAERLADTRADVIIQNGITGWSLRKLAPRTPRIVVHHGTWRGVAPALLTPGVSLRHRLANRAVVYWQYGLVEKWTAGHAVSVAVSRSTAEELRRLYSRQAVVIQNGVDLEHFRPLPAAAARAEFGLDVVPGQAVALFSGRAETRKGRDVLLALAGRAAREMPELLFVLCTERREEGWPVNVRFLPNLGYEEMPLAYGAADIFLFPTRYEGCSYSVIEAMACGLPPLMSSAGHAEDIRQDQPLLARHILPDLDLDVWWEHLEELVADDGQRRELGKVARTYAEEHNSLTAMGDAYEELILRLV
jgi:glycosyltransferase involved in cell wall biosynthesis